MLIIIKTHELESVLIIIIIKSHAATAQNADIQ